MEHLTETEILDCFAATPVEGQRNYLLAVGRAIEAKALAKHEQLRECHLSGQMSAAQSVGHFGGRALPRAELPRAELLRAAAYLAADNESPDSEGSIDADEADRIAGVLRELAA